MLLNTNR